MAIRKLYGTATLGGRVFWTEVASHQGWRVQYNETLDKASPLKAYRLLDPRGHLWASADDANEACPVVPGGKERLHWSFPDPSAVAGGYEERLQAFRRVRDDITARIEGELIGAPDSP